MPQVRRRSLKAVLAAMMLLAPSLAGAQSASAAPTDGTWGAEASAGQGQGASLLRFLSPRWALVAGLNITSTSFPDSEFGDRERQTNTNVNVGVRRYLRSGLGVRPVLGGGVLVSRGGAPFDAVGGYVEGGAVYLFNPHVSLGAIGTASAVSFDGGGSGINVALARLIGSVYF